MNNNVNIQQCSGNINIATGNSQMNVTTICNQSVNSFRDEINKAIQQSEGTDADKAKAREVLPEIEKELKCPQPDGGNIKRYLKAIVDILPDVIRYLPEIIKNMIQ